MMESRKVVSLKRSLSVCLPSAIAEELNLKKGDSCNFILLPGYGAILRKESQSGVFPVPQEALYLAGVAGREAYDELRRKGKILVAKLLSEVEGEVLGRILPKVLRAFMEAARAAINQGKVAAPIRAAGVKPEKKGRARAKVKGRALKKVRGKRKG
jgi:bifunctional DNA-binding transcriptional regulator/antitoxin component of YhaV-PrlF toxin-antitoxin module